MLEWNILENDDGMFGRVFFEESFEVRAACGQDHLVSFAALAVRSNGHVSERLLIPQVLEGSNLSQGSSISKIIHMHINMTDHICLEIIPPQTELLLVIHSKSLSKSEK